MNDLNHQTSRTATLLMHCPDQQGVVAAVSEYIRKNNGTILHLDEHVDLETKTCFMRLLWDLETFNLHADAIRKDFEDAVAKPYHMNWEINFSDEKTRMAIFVSKESHCLYDILARWQTEEFQVEIPLIISNHPNLQAIANKFGIDFYLFPIMPENKKYQETKQMELLEQHRIDFIVLARYMRILSQAFIAKYPHRIVNIHHAFMPTFPGAKPYYAAYERGVKLIGATSHFVTGNLDAGPIIEQDVVRINHADNIPDMVRKGRDLEKTVLSHTISLYLERKILVYDNRTIVFP